MNTKTRKLTTLGMLCAIAYVVMLVGRIPIVLFLKYDPKDVIIVIAGFLFGPLSSLFVSAVVSFVEMFTASDTGWIGLIMNVLSSCSFACTAAWIYQKKKTLKGAITGLAAGVVLMTGVMLLWNYLIAPLYMGYPREAVAALLLPAFLPFNLLKGGLNTALTLLLYKPVVSALSKARLLPEGDAQKGEKKIGLLIFASVLLVTCVLLCLVLAGVL